MEKAFDFESLIDRRGKDALAIDALGNGWAPGAPKGDFDAIPMWVADMDFQAPECVREALHKAADYGIFGYSFLGDGYVKAVQNWFARPFMPLRGICR